MAKEKVNFPVVLPGVGEFVLSFTWHNEPDELKDASCRLCGSASAGTFLVFTCWHLLTPYGRYCRECLPQVEAYMGNPRSWSAGDTSRPDASAAAKVVTEVAELVKKDSDEFMLMLQSAAGGPLGNLVLQQTKQEVLPSKIECVRGSRGRKHEHEVTSSADIAVICAVDLQDESLKWTRLAEQLHAFELRSKAGREPVANLWTAIKQRKALKRPKKQ